MFAGFVKYAAATIGGGIGGTAGALVVGALMDALASFGFDPYGLASSAFPKATGAAIGFVAGFYLTEAPAVYLIPAMIDGDRKPWRTSWALMRRDGGLLRTTIRTARIGASMVFGGFLGRGFLRSWLTGCLCVRVRYETLRAFAPSDDDL